MNRTLVAAIALVAASSAFAESPLAGNTQFTGAKSRAEVTAEYLRSRDATTAFTGEDSGSAYLSARAPGVAAPVVAGQPVNAQ